MAAVIECALAGMATRRRWSTHPQGWLRNDVAMASELLPKPPLRSAKGRERYSLRKTERVTSPIPYAKGRECSPSLRCTKERSIDASDRVVHLVFERMRGRAELGHFLHLQCDVAVD